MQDDGDARDHDLDRLKGPATLAAKSRTHAGAADKVRQSSHPRELRALALAEQSEQGR
jgi:hypothetical protein